MWRRDPGVQTMIEYLDKDLPLKHRISEEDWVGMPSSEKFALASPQDRQAIMEQARDCANDFTYAARNYFWITTKKKQDQLFSLWEGQYLILQKYYELKSKGRAQKIILIKARQLGACLDPDTEVLTDDLRWVKIDTLRPGHGIMTVDENIPGGKGRGRKMRAGSVVARKDIYETAYRLTMDNGETLIATGEHRFLCKRRGGTEAVWTTVNHRAKYKHATSNMRVGDEIRYVASPWECKPNYHDGWFGGILDGEGSLRYRKDAGGIECCVSQVPGKVLDRATEYLNFMGYTFHVDIDNRDAGASSKFGDKPVHKLVLHKTSEVLRLIGTTRPSRFIGGEWWRGVDLPRPGPDSNERAWVKVVSIENLGKRRMVDLQTTDKTFIANGFVSHNSTLIEAMIAWRTMFFPNTNAIVVSVDQRHSSYLFSLMLHIHDKMPWWLKPMTAGRKEDSGLFFDNPDPKMRELHPGMNSKVMVQWSNQYSGVGQGIPVDACHVSEFADYFEEDLESIVNEDLGNSMADDPEVFGFLESTGKGAGSAAHRIWRACEARLDAGKWPKWYPFFLPSFFETTRVLAPPGGWRPPKQEQAIKSRISKEWVRCGRQECGRFQKSMVFNESRAGSACPECRAGTLSSVELTDAQLYWHQDQREQAEEQGQKALKQFLQEQAVTSEEAFQVSGYVMFNDACREWMNQTIEEVPLKKGKISRDTGTTGEIHGAGANGGHCYIPSCYMDHRGDDTPLTVWREPEIGAEYTIGVDVSEGIGQDYSVIFVNKVGRFGSPDEQVAVWRDNRTKPKELAYYCNVIGRWYNEAMMCIEYNTYQTCGDDVVYVYQYPNIFRWKHKDKLNPMSQTYHWWTKVNTKAYLHQTAVDWLISHAWIIRSKNFMEESTTYRKEEFDTRTFGADQGFCDDELLAGMVALYCSHELDSDESGRVSVPRLVEEDQPSRYKMTCLSCGGEPWGAANPETEFRCPYCASLRITGSLLVNEDPRGKVDDSKWVDSASMEKPAEPSYDML